jgi:hypothetical protein
VPRKSPYKITLTTHEREELTRRASKYTLPYFMVVRAKMVLLATGRRANSKLTSPGCEDDTRH